MKFHQIYVIQPTAMMQLQNYEIKNLLFYEILMISNFSTTSKTKIYRLSYHFLKRK